jgi:RND family efflux transporter MFP subunit
MKRKTKRVLLIIAIILTAFAIAAGIVILREPPERKATVRQDLLVQYVELQPMNAEFTVRSQGTVRPRIETVLSAEVAGTIVDRSPKWIAGGVFASGEKLLQIDPTNYRVAEEQAQALIRQRQIEFDGAEKLLSQGYRAEAEHASAAAALASAKAELVRARRNLERTSIRLPYDGMVRTREADLGQYVAPGSRLGVVFATDVAEVRLPLTDQDLRFVELPEAGDVRDTGEAEGPAVVLSATQQGELRSWDARIIRTEGVVDESSRVTYAVAVVRDPYQLSGDGLVLPIGTFVQASIKGRRVDDLFRIPRTSLKGASEVLLVEDGLVKIQPVQVVRTDGNFAYISGGIAAGDRLIITAVESPVNGMPVRSQLAPGNDS